MKLLPQFEKLRNLRRQYAVLWLTLTCMICVALAAVDWAKALYILTGETDTAIVLDQTAGRESVSYASQFYYVGSKVGGYEITLSAGQTATVCAEGATVSVRTQEETVSELLTRLHLEPGALDMVLVDTSDDQLHLTVASDLVYYDQYVENVTCGTVRVNTPDLPQGVEQVVQPGVNGTRTAVYEVVYSAGACISRQFVEEIDSTAVDEIIHVGTAVSSVNAADRIAGVSKNADGSGLLTFQSGATMKFSAAKSMTATAYTAGSGGADTCTATGSFARTGVVAVDKNVIPLGTRMYIVTDDGRYVYGVAVAEDTGVRGNVVDLYYDTYQQCINFGRRSCTVYILGA